MSHTHLEERYASSQALREALMKGGDDWLGPAEQDELAALRHPGRRETWLTGRWLAKQLVLEHAADLSLRPAAIDIRSRDEQGRGTRPVVHFGSQPQSWSLSISHSDRGVLAALTDEPGVTVGVDLAPLDAFLRRSLTGFLDTWFTEREQVWLGCCEPEQVAAAWAVKEAVYKACNIGERFMPRQIEIYQRGPDSYGCVMYRSDLSDVCDLRTWQVDGHLAARAVFRRKRPVEQPTFLTTCESV